MKAWPCLMLVWAPALLGCSDTLPRSQTGDLSRRMAPPPSCILRLPARSAKASASRSIPEQDWWKVVFPGFDPHRAALPANSQTCQGHDIFAQPVFRDGSVRGGAWPLKVQEGDIVFGAGVNKMRLLWMRTHKNPDGTESGPLVLARVLEDYAEVYSVGTFRGPPEQAKLRLERMGPEILPSVQIDGCLGHKEKTPCITELQLFLPARGELAPAAKIALERVAYGTASEPGTVGVVEYRMVSTPTFEPDAIRVIEQVAALDEQGRDLRKAELERVFRATARGFEPSESSLWERIVLTKGKTKAVAE
jgi:hypothetical protein